MQKRDIAKKILLGLAVGGIVVAAVTIPGALMPFAYLLKQKKGFQEKDARKIAQALSYLKKNRLIILKELHNTITVELTENGRRKIKQYNFEGLAIDKSKKWDGKWRIVFFDIPETKKAARSALRAKLQNLGFCQIQKSAWVCPWPCENEIQLIAEVFEITSYIQLALVEKISNDIKLQSYFDLL